MKYQETTEKNGKKFKIVVTASKECNINDTGKDIQGSGFVKKFSCLGNIYTASTEVFILSDGKQHEVGDPFKYFSLYELDQYLHKLVEQEKLRYREE